MKILTWLNPGQLFVAEELRNKVKSKCCGIKDIDVSVSRWNGNEWVVMNKDADDSDMAMVTIIPTSTSDYKIEITAYKFNEGYKAGHYGLIVCHEK